MGNSLSEKMLDLLAKEADVQQIVNEAALLLGNPVMIIDTKFHIMVSSTNMEIDIGLWKETIKEGYVSDVIISDLEESEVISQLRSSTDFILHDIPGVPGNHKALRYPFIYGQKNIGFIGIYDYISPFSKDIKDELKILSKALTIAFGKDKNFAAFSHDDYEYLLERLLRCDSMDSAQWVCERYAQISLGRDMIMVCLEKDGDEKVKKNLAAEHIRDIMQRYLYHHYSAVYENRVFMLFDLGKLSDDLWGRIKKDIRRYCCEYGLIAGISFRFPEQKYVPLALRQAVYALKWTDYKAKKKVSYFDDCMLDCMMEECTTVYPVEFFIHPALQKLREYDEEFHTEYVGTLQIYLNNFCSMKATAKELDIHYNTMKYRISMIENIIDDSLRDNNELKIRLFFSMLCMKSRGSNPGFI